MSIELLEEAAAALGGIRDEVVFLGAATLPLWITDEAAPPLRSTADVDVVAEVTTLIEYDRFEARLRSAGFRDEGSVRGRFLFGPDDLQVARSRQKRPSWALRIGGNVSLCPKRLSASSRREQ